MAQNAPKASAGFIHALQFRDEQTFDFFFKEYYRPLMLFACKLLGNEQDGEDIVQNCFAKLWSGHTVLNNPASVKSFLYTTVRNACLDYLDKQKTMARHSEKMISGHEKTQESWLDTVSRAETIREISSLIDSLPGRMQQVFTLFYIQGKNYRQIAEETHTSPETIRKQTSTALRLLREKLLLLFLLVMHFLK